MLILYLSDDKRGPLTQLATEGIAGNMSVADDAGCQIRMKYGFMECCFFGCSWVPLASCASMYGKIQLDVWQGADRRVAKYSQTTYDKIESDDLWQYTVR